MKNLLISFVRDEQGQDLIEYALLAGLISLAAYAAMGALGDSISGKYEDVKASVDAAS